MKYNIMTSQNVYIISKNIHYDSLNKCYKKIFTIDREPEGELKTKIKRLTNSKISSFQNNTPCNNYQHCLYVITETIMNSSTSCCSSLSCSELLDQDKQGELITFLLKNNYTINTDLTRLLIENNASNDILFVISYNL